MNRLLVGLVIVLCLPGVPAGADGGVFPLEEHLAQAARTADQRAVVVHDGERETMVLQTAYEDAENEFAWVIPVPSLVTRADVAEADPEIFPALYALTEPRALVARADTGSGGCGCSGGDGAPTGLDGQYAGVDVWEQFEVNNYDVAVLSAEQSATLTQWLGDNGYHVPASAAPALDHYIARDWFFTVLKIRPQTPVSPGATGTAMPPLQRDLMPIRLSFDSPEPVFPLRISSASTRRTVTVLLYVLAPHRVKSTNFTTVPVDVGAWDGTPFPEYYADRFDEALDAAGGTALVVEYAAPLSPALLWQLNQWMGLDTGRSWFLTRLRTRLGPEQMQDDVLLGPAETNDSLRVIASHPDATRDDFRLATCMILLAGIVLTGANRRFPRSWPRALCLVLALVAVVI